MRELEKRILYEDDLSNLGEYFPSEYEATMLDPRLRFISGLPKSHITATLKYIEKLEQEYLSNSPSADTTATDSVFTDFIGTQGRKSEVVSYLQLPPCDMKKSPLVWWSEREVMLPVLAKLAKVPSLPLLLLCPHSV